MYEYRIINRKTEEETFVFGRSYAQACIKYGIDPDEYIVIDREYVD